MTHLKKFHTFQNERGKVKPNIIPWSTNGIQNLGCFLELLVEGLKEEKFQPLKVLRLHLNTRNYDIDINVLELAVARMKNLNLLCLEGFMDLTDKKIELSAFIPFLTNLRHLLLKYWNESNVSMKEHGQQLGELLP